MKHLLNGAAICAALAIAAPVWAQAQPSPPPGSPGSPGMGAPPSSMGAPPSSMGAPPPSMAAPRSSMGAPTSGPPPSMGQPPSGTSASSAPPRGQMHRRIRHVAHRMYRGEGRRGHRMETSGDSMTEQLNREELARIQGGGGGMEMPPGGAPMGGGPMGESPMPPGPRPSGH